MNPEDLRKLGKNICPSCRSQAAGTEVDYTRKYYSRHPVSGDLKFIIYGQMGRNHCHFCTRKKEREFFEATLAEKKWRTYGTARVVGFFD